MSHICCCILLFVKTHSPDWKVCFAWLISLLQIIKLSLGSSCEIFVRQQVTSDVLFNDTTHFPVWFIQYHVTLMHELCIWHTVLIYCSQLGNFCKNIMWPSQLARAAQQCKQSFSLLEHGLKMAGWLAGSSGPALASSSWH